MLGRALFIGGSVAGALVGLLACVGDDPGSVSLTADEAGADAAVEAAPTDLDTGAGDAGADASAEGPPYWVFITQQMYNGQEVGGLAGADTKCDTIAKGHDYPGTYRAWLSDSTTSWSTRIAGTGPWKRADGVVVFEQRDRLAAGPIESILYTADTTNPNSSQFWSGSTLPGENTSDNCSNWTVSDSSVKGTYGNHSETGAKWDTGGRAACSDSRHLVCLRAD